MSQHHSKVTLEKLEEYFSDAKKLDSEKPSRVERFSRTLLHKIDLGEIRVWDSEKKQVRTWVKKGILSFFKTAKIQNFNAGVFEYFDKFPLKKRSYLKGVRTVPGSIVRIGTFLEPGVILMPSFINVGAYVGAGTLIDTWATVGSCAQIGANVHLSGGVGVGGVLEPVQAQPVIIEDGAFIGSRAIIVEGVYIGKQAVLGAGTVLTASTKIIDVRGKEPQVFVGSIPERAVVIPGTTLKKFEAGEFGVPCALIIGTRKESTDLKISLNDVLRQHAISV